MDKLQESLQVVRTVNSKGLSEKLNETTYRSALENLIAHKNELTQRIYFQIPGGLRGNSDPDWNKVKEQTESRCGCGNERVILPGNPRTKYEASELGSVAVSPKNEVYLKPIGGNKESTYVKLSVHKEGLGIMEQPFVPLVFTPDIFSINSFGLEKLADATAKQAEKKLKPPIFVTGKEKVPIFAINNVDPKSRTVTITPDRAVESFNPDEYQNQHSCGTE